jgi:hypothetical protein
MLGGFRDQEEIRPLQGLGLLLAPTLTYLAIASLRRSEQEAEIKRRDHRSSLMVVRRRPQWVGSGHSAPEMSQGINPRLVSEPAPDLIRGFYPGLVKASRYAPAVGTSSFQRKLESPFSSKARLKEVRFQLALE